MSPDIDCESSNFTETKCQSLKEFFSECCRSRCCNDNKKARSFEKARERLSYEISIIELIRSQRYIKSALEELLPSQDRKRLSAKSNFILIDEGTDEFKLDKLESKNTPSMLPQRIDDFSDGAEAMAVVNNFRGRERASRRHSVHEQRKDTS